MTEQKYEEPIAEVQQEDVPAPVRVEIVGTVATKALPGLDGDLYSEPLGTVRQVINIAGGDPRRSRLVIWSDKPVRIATSREKAVNPNTALLAAGQQLVILHRGEVWACATVVDTIVSASVERWAD